jgi:hypothetical protein
MLGRASSAAYRVTIDINPTVRTLETLYPLTDNQVLQGVGVDLAERSICVFDRNHHASKLLSRAGRYLLTAPPPQTINESCFICLSILPFPFINCNPFYCRTGYPTDKRQIRYYP